MAYKETDGKTTFSWYTEELFDKANIESLYNHRNTLDKEGVSQVDKLALSRDEYDFFLMHLKGCLVNLFDDFVKMTKTVTDSLYVDADKPDLADTTKHGNQCGFSIVRYTDTSGKSVYNANRLPIIESLAEKSILNYILLEWAKTNKLADEITVRTENVKDARRELVKNLFELKKPLYGKSYAAGA